MLSKHVNMSKIICFIKLTFSNVHKIFTYIVDNNNLTREYTLSTD